MYIYSHVFWTLPKTVVKGIKKKKPGEYEFLWIGILLPDKFEFNWEIRIFIHSFKQDAEALCQRYDAELIGGILREEECVSGGSREWACARKTRY
jgi:hypothetical protein